ncbi:MAG: hypothetical protein AAFO77_06310 [Pseudomonadota bacterium]
MADDLQSLFQVLETERFTLHAVGRLAMARRMNAYMQSDEVRRTYSLLKKPPSLWQSLKRTRRPKKNKRFHHEIRVKATGDVIGAQSTTITKTQYATMDVIIADLAWRGKNVVPEIRKALITPMVTGGYITQVTNHVYARNYGSILNYHKLGFDHVGTNYQAAVDEFRGEHADFLIFTLRGQALKDAVQAWAAEVDA